MNKKLLNVCFLILFLHATAFCDQWKITDDFLYDKTSAKIKAIEALSGFDYDHFTTEYEQEPIINLGLNTIDCDSKKIQAVIVVFKGKKDGTAVVRMIYKNGLFKEYLSYLFRMRSLKEMNQEIKNFGIRIFCPEP